MARPSTAARRYAEAAFQLAQREDALDGWRTDLQLAAELVADPRIARVVDNPAVPSTERQAVLVGLLGKRIGGPALNLVRLLAERRRIDALPQVAREYDRLLNRHRGIVEALVTSSAPLTADETTALEARITKMTGSTVQLRAEVDPELIGGLTVRVGDRLLDASVRGRLERLRAQLLAGSR
jgi:F-type H+-transporting ATPase subunit delta